MADEYSEEKPISEQNEEEFLATARKQFDQAVSDEQPIRDAALKDLRMVSGDQWDPTIAAKRIADNRPCLTFSREHTFVQQVSNEARQMRGEIKFNPAEDSDRDTADVYEGMARHIQYNSMAKVAYETASEYAAGGSFGFYGFETDYCDDKTWDQEIKVSAIFDPFSVYGVLYPACFGMEPEFAFRIESYTREEYKQEFPDSDYGSWDSSMDYGGWATEDEIRVACYWWIERTPQTIERKNPDTGKDETRIIQQKKIWTCKTNGFEILPNTKTYWPGKRIPIFPVLGKVIIIGGKPQVFSVVRFQHGAQELINAYKTRIAETLGKAPISPWLVAKGQIPEEPQLRKAWENAANGNVGALEYNLVDIGGKPADRPQRDVFEPPIGALSSASAQEIDDMKATAGIFDSSLGQKSNETSGIALQRRKEQSTLTNMHFLDNLERSFDQSGRELAIVIPVYYDGPRTVRILGKDEAPKVVKINQQFMENGQAKHYKVGGEGAAKYDVVVTMARSFSSRRSESYDTIAALIQTNPDSFPLVADIMFKNSDMAGAEQLAERFHKSLPPNLQDDGSDPQAQVQALQAKLQEAQMHLQAIDAFASKLQKEQETKAVEHQAKAQIAQMQEMSKLEITKMQEATKLAVAQINASKDANQKIAELEIKVFDLLHGSSHDLAMQKDSQQHDMALADQQHQQALEQQDQMGQQAMQQQEMSQNQPEGQQ